MLWGSRERPSEDVPVGEVGLEVATDGGVCARNHITGGSEESTAQRMTTLVP